MEIINATDGVLKKEYTLKEIRQRINEGLYGKF